MPKKQNPKAEAKKAKKSTKGKIPKHGRSESDVLKEIGLHSYAGDVQLGNTGPTVVQGVMYGGMPNEPRRARGGLRQFPGKYT